MPISVHLKKKTWTTVLRGVIPQSFVKTGPVLSEIFSRASHGTDEPTGTAWYIVLAHTISSRGGLKGRVNKTSDKQCDASSFFGNPLSKPNTAEMVLCHILEKKKLFLQVAHFLVTHDSVHRKSGHSVTWLADLSSHSSLSQETLGLHLKVNNLWLRPKTVWGCGSLED